MIEVPSYEVRIYIAGDAHTAKCVCRKYAKERGACVTVTKTKYVYTGGSEDGVVIGFINYPPFPKMQSVMEKEAFELAEMLKDSLCQNSYTIWTPHRTTTIGRDKPQEKA
jgi:hypothetical protein